MTIKDPWNTALKRVAVACGAVSGAIGLIAAIGWIIGSPSLASGKLDYYPMAVTTAILLIIQGLTLALQTLKQDSNAARRMLVFYVCLSFPIALTLFLQSMFMPGSDIEGLIFGASSVFGEITTARMSPITAILFMIVCTVFTLNRLGRTRGQYEIGFNAVKASLLNRSLSVVAGKKTLLVISSGIFIAGAMISLSYASSAPFFYGANTPPVALPTAIAFMFFGLGLIVEMIRVFYFEGRSSRAYLSSQTSMSNDSNSENNFIPIGNTQNNELPTLLPAAVFIFVCVCIFMGGYFLTTSQIQTRKAEKQNELFAIGTLKAEQIKNWRADILEDAESIRDRQLELEVAIRYLRDRDEADELSAMDFLGSVSKNDDFRSVSLFDSTNKAILTSDQRGPKSIFADTSEAIEGAKQTGRATLSDFHINSERGEIEIDVIVPLHNGDGDDLKGFLLLEIDPDDFLYPLIQTWPTPSDSAETLLVERRGNRVWYLNELRHRKNTALKLSLSLTQTNIPAVMAVQGKTGIVEGKDYRGIPVLASIHKVDNSPWFVVSKVDNNEIYASVRSIIITSASAVTILLILSALTLLTWWRARKQSFSEVILADQVRQGTLFRLGITEFKDERELMREALEQAVKLTDSRIGYFHLFNAEEEDFDLYLWTEETLKYCKAEENPHYLLAEAGVWADCVRSGEPVVHNDYQNLSVKKGYPEGHVHVSRHMSVPIRHEGRIIAVAGVGNKELPYNERDVYQCEMFFSGAIKIFLNLRLSSEVEAMIKSLKKSNLELEQFAYIASHDLQEPLRMIASFLQLLEKKYKGNLDKDADEFIEFAVNGAVRLQEMVSGLLQYSRIETKGLEFQVIDPNICLKNALDNLSIIIKESGAEIDFETLPKIIGDSIQITQVFQNLIGNAIKFKRATVPVVRIGSDTIDGFIEFFVKDNGIGIEQKYEDRIFNIFQKLHGQKYEGAGIGLTICRRIVERHGGEIRFGSVDQIEFDDSGGTTFYFTIPLIEAGEKEV